MVEVDLVVVLTVVLCIAVFLSSNLGVYIVSKGSNAANTNHRSSFLIFLGYYYCLNYLRLFYLIFSFFKYNSDLAQCFIIYTQCVYIVQPAFLLFMSLSRLTAVCRSKFNYASLAFTHVLAVLMLFLVGLYALAVYVFRYTVFSQYIGIAIVIANIAAFVFSFFAVFTICCIGNSEKRGEVKLAFISLFMAAVALAQWAALIVFNVNNYRGLINLNGSPYSSSSYYSSYSYYNSSYYSLVNTMGMIGIGAEVIILLGSCVLYFIFRPSLSTSTRPPLAVQAHHPAPIGPLMT